MSPPSEVSTQSTTGLAAVPIIHGSPLTPAKNRADVLTAADKTSEPGSYRQDGDRGCALPGAGGRAMTSGTPNTVFPPQLKNIQDVRGVPTDGESEPKRLDSCHTVEIRDVWEHAEGNKCAASGAHGRGGSHHARLPLFFMEAMLGSHQACC